MSMQEAFDAAFGVVAGILSATMLTAFISLAVFGFLRLVHDGCTRVIGAAVRALERISAHQCLVIEEFDDLNAMSRLHYLYPEPDRVRLARQGKSGRRLWITDERNKARAAREKERA